MENDERPLGPTEALSAVREIRAAIAEDSARPPWYSIVIAAYTAGLFLAQLAPSGLARWAILMVLLGLLGIVVVVRRRASHLPSFWRAPGARWLVLSMAAGLFSLLALGYVLESGADLRWPWLPLGAAAFCWMLYWANRMDRVWRIWARASR
ncbi:MAG: hypothetical protein JOZ47_08640 [Kutzneria sp.]|nr:hypothetical protein [Kutzneria sp.]